MNGEGWIGSADKALALATQQIQLIRSLTPRNADAELARLVGEYRRGNFCSPDWEYDRPTVRPELIAALGQLALYLDRRRSPLAAIYAARARELALEGALVAAVGTDAITESARARFIGPTADDHAVSARAHALATEWAREPADHDPCREHHLRTARGSDDERIRSCDADDPRSLLSSMAREAGRAQLAVRVVVQPGLASLAATGDGFILIAPGRYLSRRATARTVLHEIAGHALPRARAAERAPRIYVLATARGIDDQEGRALIIERAAGFLDRERRAELAFRHLGAAMALAGATFVDTANALVALGADLAHALRVAARVHRGGAGKGGLGREVVYLTSFLRVERALSGPGAPSVERVMSCGRIAAHLAPVFAHDVGGAGKPPAHDIDLRRFGPSPTI